MRCTKIGVVLFLIVCMLSILAACAVQDNAAKNLGETIELTVSAAASLTEALNELKGIYETEHPDVKLSFNYGASGALQQQIEQGAPTDLLLSASGKNMKALMDKGLVNEKEWINLLSNELVVVTPKNGAAELADMEGLMDAGIHKIAIGIPESVPAGAYAKEALERAGLWEKLQAKTVQAKDVKQVLQYVESGNVEAGFVYKTDAIASDKAAIAYAASPEGYSPILYPVGIVKETSHPDAARALYQFLQTDEAMDVFVKYGFSALK